MKTWSERYPAERDRWFACVFCGELWTSPAALEDGSDIFCRRCRGKRGCVEPVPTCPMDGKPCSDERCTAETCAQVLTP